MIEATSLLPGLRPASFKGVTFWIEDVRQPVGRRVTGTYFPGTDIKVHDDFGIFDGPFRISGLVVGDDYVAQAEALRAAFQSPGPGTFVHPWLGPKQCVVFRPAEISFATDELRVARIDVQFDPVGAVGGGILGTLGAVLGVLGRIIGVARVFAQGGLVSGLSAFAWVGGLETVGRIISIAATVSGAARQIADSTDGSGPVELLADARALVPGPAAAGIAIEALCNAITDAGLAWRVSPLPAIAPAADAAPVIQPDPRRGAAIIEVAIEALADLSRSFEAEESVIIAAGLLWLGEMAATVTDIPFTSRQEALSWLARTEASARRVNDQAAAMASRRPALVSPAMDIIRDLSAALSQDINEVAGRLPAVRVIEVPFPTPAMIIAQHLVGDDPARIEPMLRDIVSRNRIRHPGRVLGRIEVLL